MPSLPNATIPAMFPVTVMLNILGGASKDSHNELMKRAIATPNAALHMYGKESKPARKIGHITVIGNSMPEGMALLSPRENTMSDSVWCNMTQPAGSLQCTNRFRTIILTSS
jgi:phosphoribosylaminoimidazole carboxylase